MEKNIFQTQWQKEWEDLFNCIIFSFIAVLVWKFFLFFSFTNRIVSIGDGTQYILPYLMKLNQVRGNWEELAYSPQWLGGAKPFIGIGNPLLAVLLSKLQLAPHIIYNCMQLAWQIGIGFFSYRTILGLTEFFLKIPVGNSLVLTKPIRVFIFLVTSFTPYIGWQIAFGHILSVHLAYTAILALIIALYRRNLTILLSLCIFFALIEAISGILYQYLLYTSTFGLILICGLIAYLHREVGYWKITRNNILLCTIIVISAVLVAIPRGLDALLHYMSSDASRTLHGSPQIFTYIESTFKDWLCSLPSSINFCGLYRSPYLLQELNFALGPFFLLLFLVPKIQKKYLLYPSILTIFFSVIYSSNIPYLSSSFLSAIPWMQYFRVGARSFWFTYYFLLLLVVATLIGKNAKEKNIFSLKKNPTDRVVFLLCFFSLFFTNAIYFEILCIIAFFLYFIYPSYKNIIQTYLLLFFATASILTFKERVFNFPNLKSTPENIKSLRLSILEKNPLLQFPLERVRLGFRDSKFLPNTAIALDLSSMEGYWQPQIRYSTLFQELLQKQFSQSNLNFFYPENAELENIFSSLYNIHSKIHIDGTKQTIQNFYASPRAPIWIPTATTFSDSISNLISNLKTETNNQKILSTLHLLQDDPKVSAVNWNKIHLEKCNQRKIISVAPDKPYFSMNISLQKFSQKTEAICALLISTNYSENLEAIDLESQIKLQGFPANGSLQGFLIPSNSKNIRIQASMLGPKYSKIGWFSGTILLLAFLALYFFQNSRAKTQ